MEFKTLGNTKEKVPVFGIGTWKIGVNPEEEKEALYIAIKKGIKFIDTAEMYYTEQLVGEVLKDHDDVFLATKVSPHHFLHDDLIEACKRSLYNLQIKQIDLYQLHWPNHSIPIKEPMSAMEELVDDGKIRHIGVSNFNVSELKDAIASMKRHEIVSNQVEYSILVRDPENELLDFCKANKITIIAYSPLARGALFAPKYQNLLNLLSEMGQKHNKTAVQVALNWLISKDNVVAIPKSGKKDHILEIVGAQGWHLTNKEMEELNSLVDRKGSLAGIFTSAIKSTGIWSSAMSRIRLSALSKIDKKDHSKRKTTKSSKK